VAVSALGLVAASPVLLPVMFLVWWKDKHSPFYVATRVGKDRRPFQMVKLRSMVVNADQSGVDSTSASDARVTPIGLFVRRFKLDELTQLWNVLYGDMTMVGPRPNVKRETDLYTHAEQGLLSVRPGITDFASIVFSDEGDILKGHPDADIAYNQLIRPGKSTLGLFYIERRSLWIDVQLCWWTAIAIVSRRRALDGLQRTLRRLEATPEILMLAARREPLVPSPPPGSDHVVTSRERRSSL